MVKRYCRPVSLLLCCAMAVTVAATGCSTAVTEAREFMERGDAVLSTLGPIIDSMYESIWGISGEITEGLVTGKSQYESKAAFISSDNDEYKRRLEEAKGEYEKILALTGVDDYAEYARLRLEAIENAFLFSDAAAAALDDIEKVVGRVEAGELAGGEAIAAALEPVLNGLEQTDENISAKADELREEAERLKKDREL